MKEVDIRKSGAVIIRDRRFLVTRAKDKDIFVAPGGKLEAGETVIEALKRELEEEIQITTDEKNLEELGVFCAPAAGQEQRMLEMTVFLVHEWQGEPTPANEVEEIRWINSATHDIEIGSIFEHDVMPLLKDNNLID